MQQESDMMMNIIRVKYENIWKAATTGGQASTGRVPKDTQETKANPGVEKDEAFDFNQERNAKYIVPTEERGVLEVKRLSSGWALYYPHPMNLRSGVLFTLSHDIDRFPSMPSKKEENIAVYHTL